MSGADPGCAKTRAFNLLVESSSQFGQSRNRSAGDGYPKKVIEKTVLRFLGSRTFSHGLDPKQTLRIAGVGYSLLRQAGQAQAGDVEFENFRRLKVSVRGAKAGDGQIGVDG